MPETLNNSCTLVHYAYDTTLLSFLSSQILGVHGIQFQQKNLTFSFKPIIDKNRQNAGHHFLCSTKKIIENKLQAASRKLRSRNI